MVAHAFNPRTQEGEAEVSLVSLRPAWSIESRRVGLLERNPVSPHKKIA